MELSYPEPNTNLRYARTVLPLQTRVITPGHYVFVSLYLGVAQALDAPEFSEIIIPTVSLQGSTLTFSAEPGVTRAVVLHELNRKSSIKRIKNRD